MEKSAEDYYIHSTQDILGAENSGGLVEDVLVSYLICTLLQLSQVMHIDHF